MIVGLVSSYKEGGLVRSAIESALDAADRVLVYEGPAGAPIEDPRVPESDLEGFPARGVVIQHGAWSTDAKKRTAMVKACRSFTPPVWGVWIDGDETLVNARYLRDWLRVIGERDALEPEGTPPSIGWPIKKVELDGCVSVARGRVVRVDLIDSYSVSSSVFRTVVDTEHGEGDYPFNFDQWEADRRQGMIDGRLYLPPPLPLEPFLMHRSALRHPIRQSNRLHVQEADELRKRGLL